MPLLITWARQSAPPLRLSCRPNFSMAADLTLDRAALAKPDFGHDAPGDVNQRYGRA
jgi:hypothetical protein